MCALDPEILASKEFQAFWFLGWDANLILAAFYALKLTSLKNRKNEEN